MSATALPETRKRRAPEADASARRYAARTAHAPPTASAEVGPAAAAIPAARGLGDVTILSILAAAQVLWLAILAYVLVLLLA